MMAPAISTSENPSAFPIHISATPIVAIVVHELPVITDTSAQITQADSRNTFGEMIFRP